MKTKQTKDYISILFEDGVGAIRGARLCIAAIAVAMILLQGNLAYAADSSVPADFATIQAAIDDPGTVAGDTITVAAGIHTESNIEITKSVIIAGTGIGSTIVESGTSSASIVFYPDVDNITIRDMTIRDSSQAVRFEIAGGTIDGTILDNVDFLDNSSRGIEVSNGTTVSNLTVTECNFESDGSIGLRVSSSGHLEGCSFTDCTFLGNSIGIYQANDGGTSTMSDLVVMGCIFSEHTDGQGTAIFLEECQGALIDGNSFIDNGRDIQLFKWYQTSVPMSDIEITNNTMTGTTNAVFAIFNAEDFTNPGVQTVFDGVIFAFNTVESDPVRVIYAGGHAGDDLGGLGWDTVFINCNSFLGEDGVSQPVTTNFLVDLFIPAGVLPENALGGVQTIDVTNNWWGTTDGADIEADLEVPSITIYDPFLVEAPGEICPPPPDSDGDGIPDADDNCPNSDLSPTVVIDGCDSGVANVLLEDGCTISDLIALCAAVAKNHGDFVNCVAHLTNDLRKDGVISNKERSAIQKCAAKAKTP